MNAHIVAQHNKELKDLYTDIEEIHALSQMLHGELHKQQDDLSKIEVNVKDVEDTLDTSNANLKITKENKVDWLKMISVAITSGIGLLTAVLIIVLV